MRTHASEVGRDCGKLCPVYRIETSKYDYPVLKNTSIINYNSDFELVCSSPSALLLQA